MVTESALNAILEPFHWDRALVLGLGQTGYSCVQYLDAQGVSVTVMDSREKPPYLEHLSREFPHVELHAGSFDREIAAQTEVLVMSPGVSLREPALREAIDSGVEVIGDIELFARASKSPVIAVTGSNGKSTVTTLVSRLLEAAGLRVLTGGNIGRPALELLSEPSPDYYVLELSSFQLETTVSLTAEVAAILNISPDHMDRYEDLAEYTAAKARIARGARVLVTERNGIVLDQDTIESTQSQVTFGLDLPEAKTDYGVLSQGESEWLVRGRKQLLLASELSIPGRHNVANALAALAVAESVSGPTHARGVEAVRIFKGLRHRCEVILERSGVLWVNDSKGTNPAATVAALQGMDRPVVLIAGGQSKGADFSILAQAVRRYARQVVLIGEDRTRIADTLGQSVPMTLADSLQGAVSLAAAWAQSGDVVLFSPACASFDMFEDYADRGDKFCRLVTERLQ
ncbi:MAG: UDP-N-acetylmuramoyl-L-alanine--D-glutamate ligase [Arenicellales bacterium]|nr:UDP-N-acetylmuramoyl-L-alanine--D-glutamate ligase [Arenicellales bacterium]